MSAGVGASGNSGKPTLSISAAAGQLSALLNAATVITPQTAQAVGGFISQLIDAQALEAGTSAGRYTFDETTTQQLQTSLVRLAAVAVPPGESLQISSPNLNLTASTFTPVAEANKTKIGCPSPNGGEATATLPKGVLEGAEGIDLKLPISALLYVTTANFHSPPTATTIGGNHTATASPMVSFTLIQSGAPLRVQDTSARINISIPFEPSVADVCLEKPHSRSSPSSACASSVECRFWEKSSKAWSSSGCETIQTAGVSVDSGNGLSCSCDHLTDFVLIEFKSAGFLEDVSTALAAFHGFTDAATQCLARGADFSTIPFGWYAIAAVLAFNLFGLLNAAQRDRKDRLRVLHQKRRMSSHLHVPEGRATAPGCAAITMDREITNDRSSPPPSPPDKNGRRARCTPTLADSHENVQETLRVGKASVSSHEDGKCVNSSPSADSGLALTGRRILRLGFLHSAFNHQAAGRPAPPLKEKSSKDRWSDLAKEHMKPRENAATRAAHEHFVRRSNSTTQKLVLAFKSRHTLLAGLLYNGALGYTRSQTVQVLANSLALELVIVSMTFSLPVPGAAYVIQPVVVVVHGIIAGLICIPGMLISAWLFDVDVVGRILVRLACAPFMACLVVSRGHRRRRIEPSVSHGSGELTLQNQKSMRDHGAKIGIVGMCLAAVARERRRNRQKQAAEGGRLWDVLRLPLGWVLNWIFMFGLLFLFVTYLCEFSAHPQPLMIQRELLWTWGFSITQRFFVNEPLIIIASKLGLKVLRSKVWYVCFSERCIEGTSALTFTILNALRSLAAP